jgi:hypothetical protein
VTKHLNDLALHSQENPIRRKYESNMDSLNNVKKKMKLENSFMASPKLT